MTWTRSTNAGYDAAGTTQGRYLGRVKERAAESEDLVKMFWFEGDLKKLSRCCRLLPRTARCSFEYTKLTFQIPGAPSRLRLLFGQRVSSCFQGPLGPVGPVLEAWPLPK